MVNIFVLIEKDNKRWRWKKIRVFSTTHNLKYTNLSVKALANGMELKGAKLSLGNNFK